MQPKISIVIPTRNRPALALRAVRAILDEECEGVEVIVLENSDEPALNGEAVFGSGLAKLYPSDCFLSMPDNWERGVDLCSGEFIVFLSDKDVVLKGALKSAIVMLKAVGKEDCVAFKKSWFAEDRNTVSLYSCTGCLERRQAASYLGAWLKSPRHIHTAPMIYTAFFRRSLVLRIRDRQNGKFFAGVNPDVFTALSLLCNVGHFLDWDETLAVAHGGAVSTGAGVKIRGPQSPSVKEYGPNGFSDCWAPGLPMNIASSVLSDILRAAEYYPESIQSRRIGWLRYLDRTRIEIDHWDLPQHFKKEAWSMLRRRDSSVPRIALFRWYLTRPIRRVWTLSRKLAGYLTRLVLQDRVRRRRVKSPTTRTDAYSLEEAIDHVLIASRASKMVGSPRNQ